jgi:hypothetical protein
VLAERARIVLAAAARFNNKEIAVKVGVCAQRPGTWLQSPFAESRIGDGLDDEPRPGAARAGIGDDEIAATIRLKTLETLPKAQRTGACGPGPLRDRDQPRPRPQSHLASPRAASRTASRL